MNRQEASLFFRLRVVPCSPVPPNKAMQTDGHFAAAADRQEVARRSMKRTAVILGLAIALAPRPVLSCSMLVLPPAEFGSEVNSFVGVVRAHITSGIELGSTVESPGLLVEFVTSSAELAPGSLVEVFPLGTGIDCQPVPRSASTIEEQYPVGTQVSAVGVIEGGDRPRILSEADGFGTVSAVPTQEHERTDVCVDFRAFAGTYEDAPYADFTQEMAWRNFHRQGYEDYEFYQCVKRLETGDIPADRKRELQNLGHYSRYRHVRDDIATDLYMNLMKRLEATRGQRRRLKTSFRSMGEAG